MNTLRSRTLPAVLLAGDLAVAGAALAAAWWLRYRTPVGAVGLAVPEARAAAYAPLLAVGAGLLVVTWAQLGAYDPRFLLRRWASARLLVKGATFWLGAYLALTLVLRLDPPVSRLFVLLGWCCVVAAILAWRAVFRAVLTRPPLLDRVRQSVVLLGWSADAAALAADLASDPAHPLRLAGVVTTPGGPPPPPGVPVLGAEADLDHLLARHAPDVLVSVAAGADPGRDRAAADACERHGVEWRIVASAFQIFLSGLRLQMIGTVPVLGAEDLPVNGPLSRVAKRALDLALAGPGLLVFGPLILGLALWVRLDSPGPAFFRQVRLGRGGRPFAMWKLRSMRSGAEAADHEQVSTPGDDPRLTRAGRFLRRHDLDELPQLWNVLRGDMSLVGPRPERPHHAGLLASSIRHYMPRHLVRPGLTGWAQVRGLRGDTSLEDRIRHDLWYIENWSPWLDAQILLLTLWRWLRGAPPRPPDPA